MEDSWQMSRATIAAMSFNTGTRQERKYVGAYVLDPVPRSYQPQPPVFDFPSLYPGWFPPRHLVDDFKVFMDEVWNPNSTITMKKSEGTAQSVINTLPERIIRSSDSKTAVFTLCTVCQDNLNVDDHAVKLPCRHDFHTNCILPWLVQKHTCPTCRFELPTEHDIHPSTNK
jgi:hypothetical protein